jgi:hypothetical protein
VYVCRYAYATTDNVGAWEVDTFCVCAFVFTYWSRDFLAHMTLYTGTVSTTLVDAEEKVVSVTR